MVSRSMFVMAAAAASLAGCGAPVPSSAGNASPNEAVEVNQAVAVNQTVSAAPGNASASAELDGPDSSWLVGAWVTDRLDCQGDTAIFYRADGTYHVTGDDGRWSLDGDRLTHKLLERAEEDPNAGLGEEKMVPVNPPQITSDTVVDHTENRMTLRFANGKTQTSYKCPSDG